MFESKSRMCTVVVLGGFCERTRRNINSNGIKSVKKVPSVVISF